MIRNVDLNKWFIIINMSDIYIVCIVYDFWGWKWKYISMIWLWMYWIKSCVCALQEEDATLVPTAGEGGFQFDAAGGGPPDKFHF